MATTGKRQRSLRRALLRSALLVVLTATAAMFATVWIAAWQRSAVERESDAFVDEQRIADQIVALTYEQQLAAYRFLQGRDSAQGVAFSQYGERAYGQIREYLFHDLSPAARLQVERIKEIHQDYEVAAQRAFELARVGREAEARERLAGLGRRTAALDSVVGRFLEARARQRDEFRQDARRFGVVLELSLLVVSGGLIVLVILLSRHVQQRVLDPLDQFAATARRLGEGDQGARMGGQQYTEFDTVSTAFNKMADDMQLARELVEAQNEELLQTLDHLRQTLDDLQRTQSDLVQHEKLSAMGEMLAGLAHELNNPLAGVLGMAEVVRDELADSPHPDLRAMAGELAEPLVREALRARSLISNMLNFARKPSDGLASVPLAEAVAGAVGLSAHAWTMAGRSLRVQVDPELHVFADAQKLQHAVMNLVKNAFDALGDPDGGGTTLSITAERDGDDLIRLDFEDDGPGFASEADAFTPFYTTKQAGKGTGLGLALVQRFVTEFGGSVSAGNRPEGGALITLRLRRADAPLPPISPISSTPPVPEAPPPVDAPAAAARRRVLVVEDEPTLREVQRRLLDRAGMEAILAASGVEARDILLQESVDLVISDVRMPGEMDGYALLAWLERERPALARSALLVSGDVHGAADGGRVPARRILSKPFDAQEYMRRVLLALEPAPT